MKRCEFNYCKNKISLTLYEILSCKICKKSFCFNHRLLENHECNLELIKIQYKKQISDKLFTEATNNKKINTI